MSDYLANGYYDKLLLQQLLSPQVTPNTTPMVKGSTIRGDKKGSEWVLATSFSCSDPFFYEIERFFL